MHPRIDQLLSQRDGEPVESHVQSHLRECSACQAEAARFTARRAQLQALPQLDAPELAWERIRANVRQPARPRRQRVRIAVASALALAVAVVVGAVVREPAQSPQMSATPPPTEDAVSNAVVQSVRVAELVARSRELENALRVLPQRPRIERVATAGTIDTLQQRIQWLDFQLSYAPEQSLNEEQAEQLWTERVNLMDSLVKVRYAEVGRTVF
jgi:hypothetical protein